MHHVALAAVRTASASRYLQQLCKHWAHKLDVEFSPSEGRIVFPKDMKGADFPADAIVTFRAGEAGLDVAVKASSNEQLDRLKAVVASHLDRFAFREAPLSFNWR